MKFALTFRTLAVLTGVALVFWVVAQTIRVPYPSTGQPTGPRNVGELTGEREVGQTFESIRPYLSGFAFQIATYGGRTNTADVIFELRERLEDPEPLRRVTKNAREFGDHQLAVFSFEPIRDSAGKTFYASLRSPASVPGNAITVDYSNDNPYEKGTSSAMIILPTARERLATYEGTLKTHADTVFAVSHRITLWEFLRLFLLTSVRDGVAALRSDPTRTWIGLQMFVASVILGVLALRFRGKLAEVFTRPAVFPILIGVLVLIGFGLRMLYVQQLPYTNDEGSYLYDARTVLEGRLPGGDALAKAPVYIATLAAGLSLFGHTLTAGRLVSVLAGLLTAFPLFVIGRSLGGRHVGVLAATLWLLGSSPALFSAYGHTQPLQVLLATAGVAALVHGLDVRRQPWLVAAGFILGLSVATRKSSLALALPVLLLLLAEHGPWRGKLRQVFGVAVGALLSLGLFFLSVQLFYGGTGVLYATGFDLAKTSLEQLEDRGDLYATYSVKGILPFFRESLGLIALALVALGWGLERLLRNRVGMVARLAWLLPVFLVWRGGVFLQRFEEGIHFAYGLWPFWVTLGVVLVLLMFFPFFRPEELSRNTGGKRSRLSVLLPLVWFLAVGVFYAFWVKFHANYLMEFLPALTILGAVGAGFLTTAFARSRILVWGLVALVAWGTFSSLMIGHRFEHTGTFHWSSIREAAAYLQKHVPPSELVLTGAVIVPYLSGHHVPNNVAHPTWYGYGYIEPELRNVFMASTETMVDTVQKDVRWVVMEKLTAFSYLREYPDIERLLVSSFTTVTEIENPSNPITILKRK